MDTLTAACSLNAGAGRKGTGFLAAVATRHARQITSTSGRTAASPVVGRISSRAYGKKVSVQGQEHKRLLTPRQYVLAAGLQKVIVRL